MLPLECSEQAERKSKRQKETFAVRGRGELSRKHTAGAFVADAGEGIGECLDPRDVPGRGVELLIKGGVALAGYVYASTLCKCVVR